MGVWSGIVVIVVWVESLVLGSVSAALDIPTWVGWLLNWAVAEVATAFRSPVTLVDLEEGEVRPRVSDPDGLLSALLTALSDPTIAERGRGRYCIGSVTDTAVTLVPRRSSYCEVSGHAIMLWLAYPAEDGGTCANIVGEKYWCSC